MCPALNKNSNVSCEREHTDDGTNLRCSRLCPCLATTTWAHFTSNCGPHLLYLERSIVSAMYGERLRYHTCVTARRLRYLVYVIARMQRDAHPPWPGVMRPDVRLEGCFYKPGDWQSGTREDVVSSEKAIVKVRSHADLRCASEIIIIIIKTANI